MDLHKTPSVCVAFIVLDWGRATNSARQQCLFPVYFSRDRKGKGTWHWIKRGSLHLIFHSILVPERNPYLLFMSWLSYGGCLFYSMSFVGPPELNSTVLKHSHPLVFNSRLEPLTVDQSTCRDLQRLQNTHSKTFGMLTILLMIFFN